MPRLFLAFVLAPVAPLIILAPFGFLRGGSFASAGPFVFLCVFYGYPIALFLGLPLFLLHRKMGWLSWWQVVVTAALVGVLVPLVLMTGFALQGPDGVSLKFARSVLGLAAFGAGVGALSGLSFWFVGLRRFPQHAVEP